MLSRKLNGGALYIALIISIVIGITLSVFILLGFYNQKQVISRIALNQLQHNLKSAFNISQSEYFQDFENNRWMQIGADNDSIRIKKKQWGAYHLISCETKNVHQYLKQCGLYGVSAPSDTAILIRDQSRAIGLAGKINFHGACYFPKAGIKPTFIEGESFNTTSNLHSLLRQAPTSFPLIKNHFITELTKSISAYDSNNDSIVGQIPEISNNEFTAKTMLFQTGDLHLSSVQLNGNIKIVSSNDVVIENTSNLNNILLIATKVKFKKGFKGSVHVIATDSIIMEEGCILNYPSSLTLLNKSGINKNIKGIFVSENCTIYGSVICINEISNSNTTSKVMVKLNKGCEIYGLVYSSDYAHLQGKIYGTAFCDKLLIKTNSAVYENHIMDCEIDPKKYAYSVVVPGLFKNKNIDKCCKWL